MRPSVCTNLHLPADVSVYAVEAARARRMHAAARFMHGPRGVGVAVIVDGEVIAVDVRGGVNSSKQHRLRGGLRIFLLGCRSQGMLGGGR